MATFSRFKSHSVPSLDRRESSLQERVLHGTNLFETTLRVSPRKKKKRVWFRGVAFRKVAFETVGVSWGYMVASLFRVLVVRSLLLGLCFTVG